MRHAGGTSHTHTALGVPVSRCEGSDLRAGRPRHGHPQGRPPPDPLLPSPDKGHLCRGFASGRHENVRLRQRFGLFRDPSIFGHGSSRPLKTMAADLLGTVMDIVELSVRRYWVDVYIGECVWSARIAHCVSVYVCNSRDNKLPHHLLSTGEGRL